MICRVASARLFEVNATKRTSPFLDLSKARDDAATISTVQLLLTAFGRTRGLNQTARRILKWRASSVLQAVERLGVTLQDFACLGVADPALFGPAADFVQRAQVGGDVSVAVVGADHQIIFSAKF